MSGAGLLHAEPPRRSGDQSGTLRCFCENCGTQASFTPLFATRLEVWRCSRCAGWSYLGRVDTPAERLYDAHYFSGGEYADYAASLPSQRRNFSRKLRILGDAGVSVGAETRALEIGCATGAFLQMLRAAGVRELLGVEVSEYARQQAQSAGFGVLDPDAPELESRLRELRPNLIVAWDVWEHLRQPASVMDAYLRAADPGVAVALTTVDSSSGVARLRRARWRQFHPPTHLHYPTRSSFRRFFAQRGMQTAVHCSFGYHRPALEYLSALGAAKLLAAVPALRAFPVYLNLWDTQLIVARRRP
jgi:hypothetical protein